MQFTVTKQITDLIWYNHYIKVDWVPEFTGGMHINFNMGDSEIFIRVAQYEKQINIFVTREKQISSFKFVPQENNKVYADVCLSYFNKSEFDLVTLIIKNFVGKKINWVSNEFFATQQLENSSLVQTFFNANKELTKLCNELKGEEFKGLREGIRKATLEINEELLYF